MIPLCKDVSPRNKPKCIHYAGRQQNFLKELASTEVFDILQIDIKSVGLQGKTLRDLTLEIPLRDFPNRQAFLSVDRAFNKSTVKLYFYKKDESECRSRIATHLPYLVFTNPHLEKGIRGCFSADANDQAKGVKWDDKRKEIVTVDYEIFESFEELDSDEEADNKKLGSNNL
jgi:SPX domain protein involved in polyphosphate accumulation